MTLYIVGCSKSKANARCKARDMYTGQLFALSREFLENSGARWCIASAKYGILDPDMEISPYDRTIKGMSFWEKARWGDQCRESIQKRNPSSVIILASKDYATWLIGRPGNPGGEPNKYLSKDFPFLSVTTFPLLGMGIGLQKKYLKGLADGLLAN